MSHPFFSTKASSFQPESNASFSAENFSFQQIPSFEHGFLGKIQGPNQAKNKIRQITRANRDAEEKAIKTIPASEPKQRRVLIRKSKTLPVAPLR
jgi:hypothetical protein